MNDDHTDISQLTFKFIIVGNSNVGKSSLLLRYVKNQFVSNHYPTVGMQFFSKKTLLDRVMVKMQIWDTAGQQAFKSIVRNFYTNSDAVFLVYNIAEKSSFEAISEWFEEATTNTPEDAIFILIGSQKDLEDRREVTFVQGEEMMKKFNMAFFFETSAKEDQNVDLAFQETAKLVILRRLGEMMARKGNEAIVRLKETEGGTPENSVCC